MKRNNLVFSREPSKLQIPGRDIELDFGKGRVLARYNTDYDDPDALGLLIMESKDPDILQNATLPVENGFVLFPGVKQDYTFPTPPEGFKYCSTAGFGNNPWEMDPSRVYCLMQDEYIAFYIGSYYNGFPPDEVPVFPKLPFEATGYCQVQHIGWRSVESAAFIVDAGKKLWLNTDLGYNGRLEYRRVDPIELVYLDPVVYDFLGIAPMNGKPMWQREAEKNGWAPLVLKKSRV